MLLGVDWIIYSIDIFLLIYIYLWGGREGGERMGREKWVMNEGDLMEMDQEKGFFVKA